MTTMIERAEMSNEDYVVQQLRKSGATSLEDLIRLPGLDWATVFSSVDRLNRAGFVVLERIGVDYRVSLERGA
jgi:hypothetical protein